VADVCLMVAKGAAGYFGFSAAMLADAAHSFGDLFGDAISYMAIREARKPPDATHPFGHGKYESIGAFGIAGLLMFTSVETFKSSLATLLAVTAAGSGTPPPMAITAGVAVLSIVSKELLYRVTLRAGEQANSQATVANAYHHRSDAYTSMVALVGIGGAQLGWAFCDPLAGTVVAFFIAHAGWQIGREAFRDLVDTAVDPTELGLDGCLRDAMASFPGVVMYDHVRARKSGPFVTVSLHLHVRPTLTVTEAHDIQHVLRERIVTTVLGVRDITIAIVPADVVVADAAEYVECRSQGTPLPAPPLPPPVHSSATSS